MAQQFTLTRLLIATALAAVAFALTRIILYGPMSEWDFQRALAASLCAGIAAEVLTKRLFLGLLGGIAAFVAIVLAALLISR